MSTNVTEKEIKHHSSAWQHYWQLLWFKVYTDLKIETQITYLGFLWWFLEPIFFLAIYYLVFAVVLKTRTPHFVEFLFIGVVAWRWFGPAMNKSCRSIKAQAKLMREVHVSKLIFPAAIVLNDAFKFIIIFLLVLIFLAFYHDKPTLLWLTIIPNFLCQMLLIFGLSFCFAAITPFLPDFPLIVQTIMFSLMIISGVFYNILEAPPHLAHLLRFNPIADVLINYRLPLLYQQMPQWGYMFYSGVFGLLLNIIGIYSIQKNDRVFPKVCG